MPGSTVGIQQLLENYASSPVSAGRALGDLLVHHRREFFSEALEILKTGVRTPGHAHLVNLLIDNDLLPEALANPSQFSLAEAVEFFSILSRIDPLMDTKLARWILKHLQAVPPKQALPAVHRILSILEQTSGTGRLGPMLVQLLRFPEPAIRSKVALLLGRSSRDIRWALSDRDPRVRANAVEAMWGTDSQEARRTLWSMARDPNNRVAGNALLALHKLGEPNAAEDLEAMSRHESPRFRATAAWVMGQTQDAAFREALQQLEADADENVRRNARLALTRLSPAANESAGQSS